MTTQLALLALGSLLLGLGGVVLRVMLVSGPVNEKKALSRTYVVLIRLLILVTVLVILIVVLVELLVVLVEVILVHLLEGQSLASKPVNGTRDQLLLDVLTQLVVQLEALLDVASSVVVILGGCLGGRKEVEEGLGGNCLLDNTSLLGVCGLKLAHHPTSSCR